MIARMDHSPPIRLLFVDDNHDLLEIFTLTVRQESGMELVGVLDGADRVMETVETHRPDVMLIDLTMAGKPPLDAVREAAERFPETRAIVYSGYDDPDTVDEAAQAGAWGFVSKHQDLPAVLGVVRRVAGGETVLNGR